MSEQIDRARLNQFVANVDQEILNIQAGEGTKRSGALHFEIGKIHPVLHTWEVFKQNPTQATLDTFIEIAKQDFGAPTGEWFETQARAIFISDAKAQVVLKRAFDVVVKDALYDCFKTLRLSMEPRQVEQLERITSKLGKYLQAEIAEQVSTTVASQLGALVNALKAKEQAEQVEKATQAEQAELASERAEAVLS